MLKAWSITFLCSSCRFKATVCPTRLCVESRHYWCAGTVDGFPSRALLDDAGPVQARNGALTVNVGGENNEPNVLSPRGTSGKPGAESAASIRSAVHARTLEGAISAQQAEFAHKVMAAPLAQLSRLVCSSLLRLNCCRFTTCRADSRHRSLPRRLNGPEGTVSRRALSGCSQAYSRHTHLESAGHRLGLNRSKLRQMQQSKSSCSRSKLCGRPRSMQSSKSKLRCKKLRMHAMGSKRLKHKWSSCSKVLSPVIGGSRQSSAL